MKRSVNHRAASPVARRKNVLSEPAPDLAYEVWAPVGEGKRWQVLIDGQLIGSHRTQFNALRDAVREAQRVAEQCSLRIEVIHCRHDGVRSRVVAFG